MCRQKKVYQRIEVMEMIKEFTYQEDELARKTAEELGLDYEELLLAEEAGDDDDKDDDRRNP